MKTNHVNIVDGSGRAYCHKLSKIVTLDPDHYWNHCALCQYYNGRAGMKGVECKYDDKSGEEEVVFYDPAESEKHSKMVYHRLEMMTEQEVIDSMDGYVADAEEQEEPEETESPEN